MAGKETAGPRLTTSSGSCNVDLGTSSAATDLNHGRVPEESREADNQAANRIQECHVCRFVFTNTEAFQKHAADHSLGKNKNCSDCGKLFKTAWVVRRHLRTHGEPSFECGVCGKTFYSIGVRKKHMLSCHVGAHD